MGKKLLRMGFSMEDAEKEIKEVEEKLGTFQEENIRDFSDYSFEDIPCEPDIETCDEPEEYHKYIYLDKNIFHSGIVNRLREKEDGDYLTVVFLHMLAQQSFRGSFWDIEDAEESLPEQIAWDIGENPEAVKDVWSYLEKWGKIHRSNRGRYEIREYY